MMDPPTGNVSTVLRAFLFTDLVGSTDLKQRLGDAASADVITRHDGLFRRCLSEFGGREDKDTGDGFLASFAVPSEAVRCALAFQQRLADLESPEPLKVRVGIHVGEILLVDEPSSAEEERKLVGLAVDTAARVMGLAQGGQILLTRGAYDSARQQVRVATDGGSLKWKSHGPYVFKGLDDALEIFEVGIEGISPLRPPQKAEKAAPGAHAEAASGLEGLVWGNFVGRAEELGKLKRGLDRALAGQGALMMIVGQPGIGKTRLAKEAAAYARLRGARVLTGGCHETEAGLPYLPFVEVLRDLVGELEPEGLKEALGDGAAAVAKLVPEIGERIENIPEAPKADPEMERYRLFENVCSFLSDASKTKPLLVILEDLHWADEPSLLLLQHLTRKLKDNRLLVVGTYRDVDLDRGDRLSDVLAELRRERLYEGIRLSGLSLEEVGALLETVAQHESDTGGRELAQALQSQSEGNPFFIEEIVRHLTETGVLRREGSRWVNAVDSIDAMEVPEGVKQVIGWRLSRLSEPCNQMLHHAAVLGREFELDVLVNMVGESEEDLIASIEEAQRAQVIEEVAGGRAPACAFTHALIRETLYEELSHLRKRRLHEKAAHAIEGVHASELEPHVAELAVHYGACATGDNVAKAVDYSLRAGEAAGSVFAWRDAIDHLQTASALMETNDYDGIARAQLLERVGRISLSGGLSFDHGFDCLERALQLYQSSNDSENAAKVHIRLGNFLSHRQAALRLPPQKAHVTHMEEHFRRAEALLEQGPPGTRMGSVYNGMAGTCSVTLKTDEGLKHVTRALEIERSHPRPALRLQANFIGAVHLFAAGHIGNAFEKLEEIAANTDHLDLSLLHDDAKNLRTQFSLSLLDPKDTQSQLSGELEKGRHAFSGSVHRALILSHLSCSHLQEGRLSDGALLRDASAKEMRQPGNKTPPSGFEKRLSEEKMGAFADSLSWLHYQSPFQAEPRIALWQGDWNRNAMAMDESREQHRVRGWRLYEIAATAAIARLRRRQGDCEGAETLSLEVVSVAADAPHVPWELRERAELALLYAEQKRGSGAQLHLERCREIIALGEDWRGLKGRVDLAEAAVTGAEGAIGEAEVAFAKAIDTFRHYTLPWDEAEAMQLWGRALRDSGKSQAANEKFDAALAIYHKMGADKVWSESVEADKRQVRT